MVFVDGRFDRFETPWGYVKDGAGQFHAYIRDYQGRIGRITTVLTDARVKNKDKLVGILGLHGDGR